MDERGWGREVVAEVLEGRESEGVAEVAREEEDSPLSGAF